MVSTAALVTQRDRRACVPLCVAFMSKKNDDKNCCWCALSFYGLNDTKKYHQLDHDGPTRPRTTTTAKRAAPRQPAANASVKF